MWSKKILKEKIIGDRKKLENLSFAFIAFITTTLVLTGKVFAAELGPAAEINLIVERVIQIMTQVGSAVLLLFIVRDAFTILERKDDPMVRTMLMRDVFLLVVAAIFLFNPNLILDAIRFIANV